MAGELETQDSLAEEHVLRRFGVIQPNRQPSFNFFLFSWPVKK